MKTFRAPGVLALCLICSLQPAQAEPLAAVNASVRAAFTPDEDVAGELVEAIGHARRQVLLQAYAFNHQEIARALMDARRRGVEVKLILDREQALAHGLPSGLERAGVPVWLDGEHQSAHNKVLIIDAGTPNAMLITGSFNFTRAAQRKNAENVVFITDSDALVATYVQNWQRHLVHSQVLSLH